MKLKSLAQKRGRLTSSEESGFTTVEMIIAIPIVFLMLGLIFVSVGITTQLMGQVTAGAAAARMASTAVGDLSAARNCAEFNSIAEDQQASDSSDVYALKYSFECQDGKAFPFEITVKKISSDKVFYTKSLTLAAM